MNLMKKSAPLSPELRNELESIYRDVETELTQSGVTCWLSGQCCDFERSDHQLFASSVEVAYVQEKHGDAIEATAPLCPFWKAGRCTERERRPLGCRTYFCDDRHHDDLLALYERYYQRLRRAAVLEGFEWKYAPFVDEITK